MLKEKAEDLRDRLRAETQMRFIRKVAAEDGIEWEAAYNLCMGLTDPIDYHYTLGYKMADPVLQTGLWGPGTKKEKAKVLRMFESELCPEEIEILHSEVLPMKPGAAFRSTLRREKKKRKGGETEAENGMNEQDAERRRTKPTPGEVVSGMSHPLP